MLDAATDNFKKRPGLLKSVSVSGSVSGSKWIDSDLDCDLDYDSDTDTDNSSDKNDDCGRKMHQEGLLPGCLQHMACPDTVQQEIIVRQDGTIEIPWITPRATPLILDIWEAVSGPETFPIKAGRDRCIYCG